MIAKGGVSGIDLGGKSAVYYDTNKKLKLMNNLNGGATKIGTMSNRKSSFGCMYRHDNDLGPDCHDTLKVA